MDVLYPCCAGLDVHKRTVAACVRRLGPDGRVACEVRTSGTMTRDLLALSEWLAAAGVTPVAMESTGVYWKPVFNPLEGAFTVLLVNPRHFRGAPGRKTDVKDCEWLAQLLQCGLLRASYIPPRPQRELRELTRQRVQLVAQRAALANRLQKVLEDANIKLASVATDVLGKSGRLMLRAWRRGRRTPRRWRSWRRGGCRRNSPSWRRPCTGT
jgi:transposase